MPRLEIKSKGQVHYVPFTGSRITIGRQAGNDIVIAENVASRKHCVIERHGEKFRVKDLTSHNGTWLGEARIRVAELEIGDTIRIGATFIGLRPDEGEAEQQPVEEDVVVVVEEDEDEVAPLPTDTGAVTATLAARAMAAGPLSKHLAPLLQACASVPPVAGAPETSRQVRLYTRKSKELAADEGNVGRTGEAIEALRQLLFVAFRTRATDIHIEPKTDIYTIRFRIDGQMQNVGRVTAKMGTAVLNVIKILCEADIAQRSAVQEGNFAVELPSRRVDFRVNMTPTVHGQNLALRFLDKGSVPDSLEGLGMPENSVMELGKVCQQEAGMVILSGPTGAGKTTTLYTALKSIDAETRNIMTIEDPVEYELENTTQISIDKKHGLTFVSVLSSVLHQDPDVILVGEIRDQETAKMAMQAATTGHLVLTTIHARDTVGTIFRLLDLGVEPFLISNAVTMCISQRLVRVLCPNCKRPFKPDARMVRQMHMEGRAIDVLYDAVGCKRCMNAGYRGRMALFETLSFNAQLRDVILTKPTIAEIRKAAGEWMFETLSESGFRLVVEGKTTFEEVNRVSGMD